VEDQQPAKGSLTEESPDSALGGAAAVYIDDAETEAAHVQSEAPEAGLRQGDSKKLWALLSGVAAVLWVVLAVSNEMAGRWYFVALYAFLAVTNASGAGALLSSWNYRAAPKWSVIAAAVAAVLFVVAGAFAGATMQPYLNDRATVATKLKVARTAANAITTLWTYNPENIDKLADRASQYLSGDFQAAYRKYLDALVAPNKQAKITNTTQVVGAAVESLSASDATAIVYTNTESTSPSTKDVPSLKYLSYRLSLQRDHARWLVTKMTTITSLDLTPKF
jgi:Mce-associated membrane protein